MRLLLAILAMASGIALAAPPVCPYDAQSPYGWWPEYKAMLPDGSYKLWTTRCSTAPPPYGIAEQVYTPDSKGTFKTGIAFNPGLLDDVTGDYDISVLSTGLPGGAQSIIFSFTGVWVPYQLPPDIAPSIPDVAWLGNKYSRWNGLYLTKTACPASFARMNPAPSYCVQISDGWTPVWTQ